MALLHKDDAVVFRGFFKEMAKLRGIRVSYQYPIKFKQSLYSESILKLSEPTRMDIVFEENPKPKTLKAIGWVSEFGDDKPYIALLPYDAENIGLDCVITVSPDEPLKTRYNKFKVTSVTTTLVYPDCWTCTVVPIFESDDVDNNYNKSNYNYLKIEDQPDKKAYGNVIENESYSYINIDGE